MQAINQQYNIAGWGDGFFEITEQGELWVAPKKTPWPKNTITVTHY